MTPSREETARDASSVEVVNQLDGGRLAQVLHIVQAATDKDATTPLDEHVLLHLRHGGDLRARHLLLEDPPGTVVGYAHLDVTDEVEGASAQLVIDPARRGEGHARALVRHLLRLSPDARLRLWAHGGHPAAAALARSMGFQRHRSLWQMRRSLYSALPAAELPPGVAVRPFRPGADDAAWVAVNAAAFADHPEQGALTLADLHRRMAEPWFDPAGFFLAERAGRLVGFHWTKVHGGLHAPAHGHEAIGEVYVVGVHPDEQGTGLGRALTLVGLRHLRGLGLASVMLYVDESNTAAIRLYSSLGFTRWDVDVQYAFAG